MPKPIPRHLAATLSILMLMQACTAPHAQGWPAPDGPKPQAPRTSSPTTPSFAPIHRQPSFAAPSASHCRQTPALREVPAPGYVAQQGHSLMSARIAPDSVAADAALGTSKAAAPLAMAAPSPAPAVRTERAPGLAHHSLPYPPQPAPAEPRPANETVTAGLTDDNADFAAYLAYRQKRPVSHLPVDVSLRQLIEVKDADGKAVPDAEVRVQSPQGNAIWARTDSAGRVWVHPLAMDMQTTVVRGVPAPQRHSATYSAAYQAVARNANGESAAVVFIPQQKSAVELRLAKPEQRQARAQLDLVFLIDATGSMADEIDKLKTSMRQIANEVARLPAQPDICFAFVAYRDRGDAFLLRTQDFTDDLSAFQRSLAALQAGGGGDYPEAMGEALEEVMHKLSWRGGPGQSVQRMVVLVADAPPHFEPDRPPYTASMEAALGKGIKIHSVAASGLDPQGEFIHRQLAQYTGGKFVFLTYAKAQNPSSGPGRETVHEVNNYSVDTLDKLIVRLVREELAALAS